MYQIEKIGDDCFYVKAIGTFPLPVAERFVIEFEDLTKDIHENLNVIIDLLEHAESSKRKIVSNLEDAKEWIGIGDVIFKKD
jgi:hypothetical protein